MDFSNFTKSFISIVHLDISSINEIDRAASESLKVITEKDFTKRLEEAIELCCQYIDKQKKSK